MAKIFFVSDVHLDPQSNQQPRERFCSFLEFIQREEGDLYILGDLFDYWVNNNCLRLKNTDLFRQLGNIAAGSHRVGLLYGNRDFLLSEKMIKQFGIEFLGESCTIQLGHQKVLLTHGDIFSAQDPIFRLFRRYGWPLMRQLDRLIPGVIKNRVANKWALGNNRRRSQKGVYKFSPGIIQPYFEQGYDTIICGHLHHGYMKTYPGNKKLIVLPGWQKDEQFYLLDGDTLRLLIYKDYG